MKKTIVPLNERQTTCKYGHAHSWLLGELQYTCQCGLVFEKSVVSEIYVIGGDTSLNKQP